MNKNDLRYKKTESNIHNSYLTLLETLPCKEITIKKICEHALCSRNTFYLHYTSKDHLYESIIRDLLADIKDAFKSYVDHARQINTEHYIAYCDAIIQAVIANKKTLKVLIKNDSGIFFKQFYQNIEDMLYNETTNISSHDKSDVKKLYAAYVAASVTGFIFEWLKNDDITDDNARKLLYHIHINTMASVSKAL